MNRRQRRGEGKRSPAVRNLPPEIDALFTEALLHHRAGRIEQAETNYLQVLGLAPLHSPSLGLLGLVALQSGHPAVARDRLVEAIGLQPAEPSFRAHLGAALRSLGHSTAAARSLKIALVLRPSEADYHFNVANALADASRFDEAVRRYRTARNLLPEDPDILNNLGNAAEQCGLFDEAERAILGALALRPDFPEAYNNFGNIARRRLRLAAAAKYYRRALAASPVYADAQGNLGLLLREHGDLDRAAHACRLAIVAQPCHCDSFTNMGNILGDQGKLDLADEAYRYAILCRPNAPEPALQRVFLQLYRPAATLPQIQQVATQVVDRYFPAAKTKFSARSHAQPRIGFLSGDFRAHVVGQLVLPTIEGLSRAGWKLTLYSNAPNEDELSGRFKASAGNWRNVRGMDDAALGALIAADGVDILVDLSGYTAHHRLALMAAKPAPLQLAWAGYPATTGLSTMDYILADRHQIPVGAESFYREKVVRLPASYILFQPPAVSEHIDPLPAIARGIVTFGSFNILKKITPPVFDRWASILLRLPDARLLLKARALDCAVTLRTVVNSFAQRGISAERLDFRGASSRADHLRAMTKTDLALDSFPYSGGMTTLECLWMGLPVVTLPGDSFASRHSLGYLATIGLGDLVAADDTDYVEKVVALAANLPHLAELRAGMRARLAASPLMDEAGFIGYFEAALTAMWARYMNGLLPSDITIDTLTSIEINGKLSCP